MAEYIKREDAISHPFANERYDRKNANLDFILGYESYKEWLENLPAADVVEVVRCKDCGYADFLSETDDYCFCIHKDGRCAKRNKDFFCAYGERRR